MLLCQWVKVSTSFLDSSKKEFKQCKVEIPSDGSRRIIKNWNMFFSNEEPLWEILEKHGIETTFKEAWAALNRRFKDLMLFSGGLTTVFPGTPAVELDLYLQHN